MAHFKANLDMNFTLRSAKGKQSVSVLKDGEYELDENNPFIVGLVNQGHLTVVEQVEEKKATEKPKK